MSNTEAKTLSIIAHLAGLFSSLVISVLVPICILLLGDNAIARANARESLNFQINLFIWALIGLVLCIVLVGFVLLGVLVLLSIILPIVAALRCAGDENLVYRYPFCFRILS